MRNSRLVAIGGVVLVVTALLVTSVAAFGAAAPTGNRQGIAFAHAQQRAYAKIRAVSYTQVGFVAMRDEEGKTSFFNWTWGTGIVPSGWAKATERGEVGLRNGRVVWWRDDLMPAPCTAPGLCSRIPVEIVVERSGAFYAFGSAANHTCYAGLNGSTPYRVGAPFDSVGGHFDAPLLRGGAVILRHAYPWYAAAKQTATETDTGSARTRLVGSQRVSVNRGTGPNRPAFTFKASYGYPVHAQPPRVNRCRG